LGGRANTYLGLEQIAKQYPERVQIKHKGEMIVGNKEKEVVKRLSEALGRNVLHENIHDTVLELLDLYDEVKNGK
jgi:hypothetical protein